MKPSVRMLVAVWGARYVDRFTELSLASILAPGNLPALAGATDLELVILTSAGDQPQLDASAAIARVREHCRVNYENIDDLIADQIYGVTLTLAYHRGVTSCGATMLEKHFLFLNSDLILADGSLRAVAHRILKGERAILANSIRAISEELEGPLRARAMAGHGTFVVSPRELVGMALEAMHPTQIAKIVNSGMCHSIHVNQFYWQVDSDTLVSRHFLMFMLCLRPTRLVAEAQGFCDYTFVSEMCPNVVPTAMGDSDEFFALEIQHRDAERAYLRLGKPTVDEVARGLSEWTTGHHRDNALRHMLLFHAGDLSGDAALACEEAGRYVRRLVGQLSPEPQPVRRHPYWVGALLAWRNRLISLGKWDAHRDDHGHLHAIIEPTAGSAALRPARLRALARRWLVGELPALRPWHPDWLDYRPLKALLSTQSMPEMDQVLYVDGGSGRLRTAFAAAHVCTVGDLLSHLGDGRAFALVLIEAQKGEFAIVRRMIEQIRPYVKRGGRIAVFAKDVGTYGATDNFAGKVLANVEHIVPRDLCSADIRFAGGMRKRKLRDAAADWISFYRRGGKMALPIVLPALALIAVRALLNNLKSAWRPGEPVGADCSSFLMTVTVDIPENQRK